MAQASWTMEQPLVGRERKCEQGKVLIFACQDVDLLSFLPVGLIGGGRLNDVWGWSDPTTGREFAVVGRSTGTSFVEITDPVNPRYLGELPTQEGTNPTIWRSVKVYKNYAFIVADRVGQHGVQIFDLAQLLEVKAPPLVFRETAHYNRINSAHSILVDTLSGFIYTVGNSGGGETCGGGLHMIDVHTPTTPTFAGCYPETLGGTHGGRIHDAQCVTYRGPDQRYRGREICLNGAEQALGIVDVTDKQHPQSISIGNYPNAAYTHQGWLSEDHRYFFLDDEQDEGGGNMTRTIVFDLKDLTDPVVVKEFFGTTTAIDHNLYVRGRYVYESNYTAGLRVLDGADPANPKEVAYIDIYPNDDAAEFSGTWSNYPYFKSGLIAVTSMNDGLYIVRHRSAGAAP